MVTALVMAGGKGTRMDLPVEKPLLRLGGKQMIKYVLDALRSAKRVNDIVVTVSGNTPEMMELMRKSRVEVLETPGESYVSDMIYAVKKLGLKTTLIISADIPLVTGEFIDKVLEHYEKCGKPALTVATPIDSVNKPCLNAPYIIENGQRNLVPIGINVIDGEMIGEDKMEEEMFITQEGFLINVNTRRELKIVEDLIQDMKK
jgi:adenosylcobinamide-phosphate guanylyltransferase